MKNASYIEKILSEALSHLSPVEQAELAEVFVETFEQLLVKMSPPRKKVVIGK